jgi:hypothetical protein
MTMNRRDLLMAGMCAGIGAALAADPSLAAAAADPTYPLPDPKVMIFRLPKDLEFDPNKTRGAGEFVLWGDPNQEGIPYGVLQKWYPNSMSHPHFHLHDRYIYVVSGTWWVGSGLDWSPDRTYPMHAGGFVHHLPMEIHYDGAKDEPCVMLICGTGPARGHQPSELHLYRSLPPAEQNLIDEYTKANPGRRG